MKAVEEARDKRDGDRKSNLRYCVGAAILPCRRMSRS
mgnify:CR=1 FL=1